MVAKKINADWKRLQNTPDNWFDIPDFNVCPMDVGFHGFSRPIVGPTAKDTAFHAAVREVISEVRGHASKRFKSMADLLRIDDEGAQRFKSEIDLEGVFISSPVGDELFVYRYNCIFAFLDAAVEGYVKNKNGCIDLLAFAVVEVAKMMTNAAADPDQLMKTAHARMSKAGGIAKRDKDPKQIEKAFVKECWKAWQKEPHRYENRPAFIRDMVEKCELLENKNSIRNWCGYWEKNPDAE